MSDSGYTLAAMRAYALAELGDRLAVDLFVRKEDGFQALDDALNDEPQWAGMLFVAPIELDESQLPRTRRCAQLVRKEVGRSLGSPCETTAVVYRRIGVVSGKT